MSGADSGAKAEAGGEAAAGALYAVAAYLAWGLVAFYWRALGSVPPIELLAHRMLWSLVFVTLLLAARGRGREALGALRSWRVLRYLVVTTALISVNWGVFIWAVQSGRLLQSSLGYFINPLVNVLLGVLLLGERMRPGQIAAALLALGGVVNLAVATGVVPWVSLLLAVTFALYGFFRKVAPVDALTGLFVETALFSPFALALVVHLEGSGLGALGQGSLAHGALLAACGVITALPLLWFTEAARRLKLSTLGFFQYISPTCQFLLAALVFGEKLSRAHLVTFGCIWAALALFSAEARWAAVSARGRAAADR